jgi:hypothetical protein
MACEKEIRGCLKESSTAKALRPSPATIGSAGRSRQHVPSSPHPGSRPGLECVRAAAHLSRRSARTPATTRPRQTEELDRVHAKECVSMAGRRDGLQKGRSQGGCLPRFPKKKKEAYQSVAGACRAVTGARLLRPSSRLRVQTVTAQAGLAKTGRPRPARSRSTRILHQTR